MQVLQAVDGKTAQAVNSSPVHPMHCTFFVCHNQEGIDRVEHGAEILVLGFLAQSGLAKLIHHFVDLLRKLSFFALQMAERILQREVACAYGLNQLAESLIAFAV